MPSCLPLALARARELGMPVVSGVTVDVKTSHQASGGHHASSAQGFEDEFPEPPIARVSVVGTMPMKSGFESWYFHW